MVSARRQQQTSRSMSTGFADPPAPRTDLAKRFASPCLGIPLPKRSRSHLNERWARCPSGCLRRAAPRTPRSSDLESRTTELRTNCSRYASTFGSANRKLACRRICGQRRSQQLVITREIAEHRAKLLVVTPSNGVQAHADPSVGRALASELVARGFCEDLSLNPN